MRRVVCERVINQELKKLGRNEIYKMERKAIRM
jgi:hypothetical protein